MKRQLTYPKLVLVKTVLNIETHFEGTVGLTRDYICLFGCLTRY